MSDQEDEIGKDGEDCERCDLQRAGEPYCAALRGEGWTVLVEDPANDADDGGDAGGEDYKKREAGDGAEDGGAVDKGGAVGVAGRDVSGDAAAGVALEVECGLGLLFVEGVVADGMEVSKMAVEVF